MTASRRQFLGWAAVAGTALVVPLLFEKSARSKAVRPKSSRFEPSRWIAIDQDGQVILAVGKSEMGQGVRTALPMILADELGADWSRIRLVQAEPGPGFETLATDASSSVRESWLPLRAAGAAAREMLIAAAASRWGIDPGICRTELGAVVETRSGRRAPFGELVDAASRLPVPARPRLKGAQEFRLIGSDVKRVDTPAIVAGHAIFGIDVRLPGMRHAVVARCPRSGGRAIAWNAAQARTVSGVLAVEAISTGVAVIATSTFAAIEGRSALETVWKQPIDRPFDSDSFARSLSRRAAAPGIATRAEGDGAAGLARSTLRLGASYEFPFQAHAPMEPPNCVARVGLDGCEIWAGTQTPNQLARAVAKLLGIPPDKVIVHVTLLGGGFGRRQINDFALEAAEISKISRAPIQLLWTREDDLRHDHFHPASFHRMRAGVGRTGELLAWSHRVVTPSIRKSLSPGVNDSDASDMETVGATDFPYRAASIRVEYVEAPSPVPLGWRRGIEHNPNVFARESFLDELARAAGRDPLEYRLEMLGPPRTIRIGEDTLDVGRLRRVVRLAAEKSDWYRALPAGIGRGVACCAQQLTTFLAHVAEVAVGPDGKWRVRRVVTAVDCGQPINPLGIRGQIESGVVFGLSGLISEITFRNGAVAEDNFDRYPALRASDMPEVEVHIVPSSLPPTGVGEMAVPPLAPAVANAIFDATGRRVRRLPIRPADVLAAAS